MPQLKTRDRLNAFLDLPEVPVAHAASGPLAGLTLGVKDIFDVAGYVSGWGNPDKFAEGTVAATTAPAVQKLLDAGARFIGKTQTEELAFSMIGQNVHFPHPVNPRAPDRITGGSSSGSAAAVAGGLVDIGTGSDTGGSVRAPASFCGLIGLRTTHGAISLEGTMPLAPSFDTFGWFTKRCGNLREGRRSSARRCRLSRPFRQAAAARHFRARRTGVGPAGGEGLWPHAARSRRGARTGQGGEAAALRDRRTLLDDAPAAGPRSVGRAWRMDLGKGTADRPGDLRPLRLRQDRDAATKSPRTRSGATRSALHWPTCWVTTACWCCRRCPAPRP